MTIGVALDMQPDEFLGMLREEVGHSAFSLMPKADQEKVVDWYKTLTEDELVNIFGYRGIKGVDATDGKRILEAYRKKYKNSDNNMADEAAQWEMRNRNFHSKNTALKVFQNAIRSTPNSKSKSLDLTLLICMVKFSSKEAEQNLPDPLVLLKN
jgi:16S rRNA C1402 N4-methylase RsmH